MELTLNINRTAKSLNLVSFGLNDNIGFFRSPFIYITDKEFSSTISLKLLFDSK